jgi:biopolymer transport protein ExbD
VRVILPARRPVRIEMVPLIDTFFLLLAFFISSVLTMEVVRGLPVDLPRDRGAANRLAPDRLLVAITEGGLVELDGSPVTLEGLRAQLENHSKRQELRIGLRADRGARYEQVVQVLEVVQQAGVSRVSLLTRPGSKRGKVP